jgi:hypothetical protein
MDYTITLTLSEEQRALIDEARGDADLATFIQTSALSVAEELVMVEPEPLENLTPGLSAADHIRLANEAAAGPTLSLAEVRARLDAKFAALRAREAEAAK